MHDILINWAPQETRVAIIENGAVQELHIERTLERGLVGNIYLGKVARVLPGMQSAFIDIGLERAAFLHVADLHTAHAPGARDSHPPTPIEKLVFEGQTLTVQVVKDPIGTKGARLSTQISIAGRMLVFLPQDNHIGISQKIGSVETREQLRQRMIALVGKPEPGSKEARRLHPAHQCRGGQRHRAVRGHRLPAQDLGPDPPARGLAAGGHAAAPGSVPGRAGAARPGHRADPGHPHRLAPAVRAAQGLRQAYMPASAAKLEHYRGERPIFDLFNVEEEIAGRWAAGGPEVRRLPDHRPDRGADHHRRQHRRLRRRAQLRRHHLQDQPGGGQAIARQLRLRNLGGIIIIDFIDMAREEHQQAVLAELRKQLSRDRTKTTVSGFTQLGLVEMTRKRTREPGPCAVRALPDLRGRGQVKTARSVCYDILREILREARQFNPKEFRVVASARWSRCCWTRRASTWPACRTSSASPSRCRPSRP
jgi:ribonuclease G